MFYVAYYMKGQPKQVKAFQTRSDAKAFYAAMMQDDNCEGVCFDKGY